MSRHARLFVSYRVVRKTPDQQDRRVFTVGPHWFSVHYSPMIGRLAGTRTHTHPTKSPAKSKSTSEADETSDKSISLFQANKLQLGGPVPPELKHKYVGYRPFITSLFTKKGIKGRLLNYALHKQYITIYYYSRSTEYGVVDVAEDTEGEAAVSNPQVKDYVPGQEKEQPPSNSHPKPSTSEAAPSKSHEAELERAIATRFLHMTHFGRGHRLFTYILTLDGEWRFTETGPEFTIDMLSKHSMHSDIQEWIAYSGEFFVRRIDGQEVDEMEGEKGEENKKENANGDTGDAGAILTPKSSEDPKDYELVIDNDSGTYRPKKELLPVLQEWLASPRCLGGLGQVTAMDGFDKLLEKMKEDRKKAKEAMTKGAALAEKGGEETEGSGEKPILEKVSSLVPGIPRRTGSISSSDVDEVIEEAKGDSGKPIERP